MRALFRDRTPTQSEVQGENLDQLVSWQSSLQGNWQDWLTAGIVLANLRHRATSANVPSSCLQEIAAEHTQIHERSGKTQQSCRLQRGYGTVPDGTEEVHARLFIGQKRRRESRSSL